MKKINKSLLKAGAFACLVACYGTANAAWVNVSLKKSDNTGYENATVSYLLPGRTSFALLGNTNSNGELSTSLGNTTGQYVIRILAGHNVQYDTFNIVNSSDVHYISNQLVKKYAKYTSSQDVPYVDANLRIQSTLNSSSINLRTNNEGMVEFEAFPNSQFKIIVKGNDRTFDHSFDVNAADTFNIHTVKLNIHWPYNAKYKIIGNRYYNLGNASTKTVELLPGNLEIDLTKDGIVSTHDVNLPYNGTSKVIDITPVRILLKNSNNDFDGMNGQVQFKIGSGYWSNRENINDGHITKLLNGSYANTELYSSVIFNGARRELPINNNISIFNTHKLNIYWPHELIGFGTTQNTGIVKSYEVFSGSHSINFVSTYRTYGTHRISIPVSIDIPDENYEITAVALRTFKNDKKLLKSDAVLNVKISNVEHSTNIMNNGCEIIILEGNKTNDLIGATISKWGKSAHINNRKIIDINHLLDYTFASLALNTIASSSDPVIDYKTVLNGSYQTIATGNANTPVVLDVIPTTYNFQATHAGSIEPKYALNVVAGNNHYDFQLNKITINYVDANNMPLEGGEMYRIANPDLLATSDINGKAEYFKFNVSGGTEAISLQDPIRNYNKPQTQFTLTARQDGEFTLINPNSYASPVSDFMTLEASTVSVYPNPANDYIQVKMNADKGEVYIYNTVGQLVYSNLNVVNNQTIDVTTLPTGNYNVIILANDQKEVIKMAKN